MQPTTGTISPYVMPGLYRERIFKPVLTADIIIQAVCKDYGLQYHKVFEKCRSEHVVLVRQIAQVLIRELMPWLKLKDIASLFNQDHTMCIYASKVVSERRQTERDYEAMYQSCAGDLLSSYEIKQY